MGPSMRPKQVQGSRGGAEGKAGEILEGEERCPKIGGKKGFSHPLCPPSSSQLVQWGPQWKCCSFSQGREGGSPLETSGPQAWSCLS